MTREREAFLRGEAAHDVRVRDCLEAVDALRAALRYAHQYMHPNDGRLHCPGPGCRVYDLLNPV